jgi:hypothetical protein
VNSESLELSNDILIFSRGTEDNHKILAMIAGQFRTYDKNYLKYASAEKNLDMSTKS